MRTNYFSSNTFIIYFIIILFLSSCYSIKPSTIHESIKQEELSKIEGTYMNLSMDSTKREGFWEHLKPFNLHKDPLYRNNSNTHFELKLLEGNKIQFDLYLKGEKRRSKIFKYKYEAYGIGIKCNKNRKYEGIPLLFYRHHCEALWISIDKNENLILSHNGSVSGGVLIFIFGNTVKGLNTFKRVGQ